MVRILLFPTPNSEYGYYRSWYENSVDILFEDKMFSGIIWNYHRLKKEKFIR